MMRPATAEFGAPDGASATGAPDVPPVDSAAAVSGLVQSLLRDVWTLVQDHALLTVLEVQRATRTVTIMLFSGVVVAVLLVTAWLALVASLLFWVVDGNQAWGFALLLVGLIHVALSAAIIWWIRRLASNQMFSALLRQVRPDRKASGVET
jgi:uncharacterized membrane protein YqjE